jgi:hypothetical protein
MNPGSEIGITKLEPPARGENESEFLDWDHQTLETARKMRGGQPVGEGLEVGMGARM